MYIQQTKRMPKHTALSVIFYSVVYTPDYTLTKNQIKVAVYVTQLYVQRVRTGGEKMKEIARFRTNMVKLGNSNYMLIPAAVSPVIDRNKKFIAILKEIPDT